MRRRWHTVANNSVAISVEETSWGDGTGPTFLVSHATGFCKEVMGPTVAAIVQRLPAGRVLSFDHRNHGGSDRTPHLDDWWPLADDALAVLGGRSSAIGIGHSCGGAAVAYAEILQPGTFAGLVLVEPIVFPPGETGPLEVALVRRALRRKPGFPTRQEAHANFSEKPTFEAWVPEALEAYVDAGFEPQGGAWMLRCRPKDEANFYSSSRAKSGWSRLGEIACPVVLVAGESSDSHGPEVRAAQAAQFTGTELDAVVVGGAGHFVPMETPAAVAEAALSLL